jgi:hypothetical protein
LSKANAAIIVSNQNVTLRSFLEMFYQVFQNHLRFRCLLLSFVHIMEQNKLVAAAYKKTQVDRNVVIRKNISVLAESGFLKLSDAAEMDFLVSTLALISRFWISEAAISYKHLTHQEQVQHYFALLTKLLLPYTSAKGKKELLQFAESLLSKTLIKEESTGNKSVKRD